MLSLHHGRKGSYLPSLPEYDCKRERSAPRINMKLNFLVFIVALLEITNAQLLVTLACFAALAGEMAISDLVIGITEGVLTPAVVSMVGFIYEGEEVFLVGAEAAQVATAQVTRAGGRVTATATVQLRKAIWNRLRKQYIIGGNLVESAPLTIEHSSLAKFAESTIEFQDGLSRLVKVVTGMVTHIG